MTNKSFSIATSTFNEAKNIEEFISRYEDLKKKYMGVYNFQLIICDDSSADNTYSIIANYSRERKDVICVKNDINRGAGYSIRRAISLAQYDFSVLIDSDNEYDLMSAFQEFEKCYEPQVEIYFGQRNFKQMNFKKRIGPKITAVVYRLLFKEKLNDFSCCLKIVKTKLLAKEIVQEANRMNYSNELTVKLINSKNKYKCFKTKQENRKFGLSNTKILTDGLARFRFTIYLYIKIKLIKSAIISENLSEHIK